MSLEDKIKKLDSFARFARKHRHNGNGFALGNHQLLPIYEAVENGLRRFLLAYGTGAGKTVVPIEIFKHLLIEKPSAKVLVISPRQTLDENWNHETMQDYGLDIEPHQVLTQDDLPIPKGAQFVAMNYEKLPQGKSYLSRVLDYAESADLVVVDEFHNIKKRTGKRSRGFQKIVEVSKDRRTILLSASPAPNTPVDLGMMLYILDPKRYKHYSEHPYKYQEDIEAVWEMCERGMIKFFERDEVIRFHNLPELSIPDPIVVEMDRKYANQYLDDFKNCFTMGESLNGLERIAIEGLIHSKGFQREVRERLKQGYALNFFSHLRKEKKGKRPDTALFEQLARILQRLGAKRIEMIHGDTPREERLAIQRAYAEGKIDALLNQWDCTGEGFSEVAGYRPVCIIPLRSPFEPGRREQIIGRPERPGQYAPVEYLRIHADSAWLKEQMEIFVQDYARRNGVKIKSSWEATLFHRDTDYICNGKEVEMFRMMRQRGMAITDPDDKWLNVDAVGAYTKLLSKDRILVKNENNDPFGSGLRRVINTVGRDYERGLKQQGAPMGDSYNRPDILTYTPGKINLFLAQTIESLKKQRRAQKRSWKIADLGCCSSAVFAQARTLWQALLAARGESPALDHIVNVDGQRGFLRSAREILESGSWYKVIKQLKMEGFTRQDMQKAYSLLKKGKQRHELGFENANFTEERFGSGYNVVITSQCFQYNNQADNHDIERIVLNVNRSLRLRGHYLCVLTSNSFTRSFTTEKDFENVCHVIDSYGFDIKEAKQLQGKAAKGVVATPPFYFIHATKTRNHTGGLVDFGDGFEIYLPYVTVLTGGRKYERSSKYERMLFNPPKKERRIPTCPFPGTFVEKDGTAYQPDLTTKK